MIANQLAREPVEQLGVRRLFALRAKITRRGNNPAAEMMLPETIHDHSRQQLACAGVHICQPIGQGGAFESRVRSRGHSFLPMLFLVRCAHQHLQKPRVRFLLLLVEIASREKPGLIVKIRALSV